MIELYFPLQKQLEKDEFENMRGELLRSSGLTVAEVCSV